MSLIKAKDLRIGNWVQIPLYDNYRPEDKRLYKIKSICDGGVKVKYAGWGGDDIMDIEPSVTEKEITGIILTPEILKACGSSTKGVDEIWTNSTGVWLTKVFEKERYFCDGFRSRYFIEYLHQYQNVVFALTGEELIVKF